LKAEGLHRQIDLWIVWKNFDVRKYSGASRAVFLKAERRKPSGEDRAVETTALVFRGSVLDSIDSVDSVDWIDGGRS